MIDDDYIHPNFDPEDKGIYLEVVRQLREKATTTDENPILVSEYIYSVLEDAAHETMKGKGHQVYGIEIKIDEQL